MSKTASAFILILICATSIPAAEPPEISADAIAAHVRFLADDLLEGRDTGSRGHEIAARYVAAQFETMGLEPAGTGGGWMQPVPLRRATLLDSSVTIRLPGGTSTTLVELDDYVLSPNVANEAGRIDVPVVFAGYGIVAPRLKHDDYRGIDVKGKVVAVLRNAPERFPNSERAHFASTRTKIEEAAKRGAVGVVMLRQPEEEQRLPWDRIRSYADHPSMGWLDASGVPANAHPAIEASIMMNRGAAVALFGGSKRSFEQVLDDAAKGKVRSFPLAARLVVTQTTRHESISSPNVAAKLTGSDPALRNETVVFVAHLDHVGIVERLDDPIHNGAYDNASGVATMLEIAHAFAKGERPRRSILFLAVTGEEKGLLGADYFARNPTESAGEIVAAFSIDMFLMLYPLHDVIAFGAENSSLGATAEAAAKAEGVRLSPDPMPEEVLFVRTDHYPFVKRGVPALFLVHGNDSGDPGIDGTAVTNRWLQERYHQPNDDMNQTFDWNAGAKFARISYRLATMVANADVRPRWNDGDFFGDTFGRK